MQKEKISILYNNFYKSFDKREREWYSFLIYYIISRFMDANTSAWNTERYINSILVWDTVTESVNWFSNNSINYGNSIYHTYRVQEIRGDKIIAEVIVAYWAGSTRPKWTILTFTREQWIQMKQTVIDQMNQRARANAVVWELKDSVSSLLNE